METPLSYARCAACPLLAVRRPVVGHGPTPAALVVVGEAPGRWELEAGRPFVGRSGLLLDKTLDAAGMSRRDIFVTNTVACRPTDGEGNDAPPPPGAVACCRPRLLAELRLANPRIILAAGGSAARSLLGTRKGITEIGGVVEYRDDLPAPVLPTFHPAAALHGNEDAFPDLLAATKRAVKLAKGDMVLPPRDEKIPWQHLTHPAEALALVRSIARGDGGFVLALDVETGGLDVLAHPLLQVAVGDEHKGFVVEAGLFRDPRVAPAWQDLLQDPRFTWLIHNSSFDLQWLAEHFDVVPPNVVDTMCLALGTTERKGAVGLKRLAREYLNAPYYEDAVHHYLDPDGGGWEKVPRALLAEYAARDVVYTARMAPLLTDLCKEEGTLDLVRNLLEPAQRTFAELERRGVLVDRRYLSQLEVEWAPRVEAAAVAVGDYARGRGWVRRVPGKRLKHEAFEPRFHKRTGAPIKPRRVLTYEVPVVDVPLNPASPLQLAEFLFDHLGLSEPPEGRTTGEAFRRAHPDHPVTALLEDFSLKTRMLGTYVRGIGKYVRADGRVHPDIDVRGAVTGRLAMHKPALQTIPREGTAGKGFASIKRIFVPSPGHVWLSADESQLEVRVAWHLSGDDVLGHAVMSGDFHQAMAARIFGVPSARVTDDQRQQAKTTTFGIMYGSTAVGLADRLGIDAAEAQALIDGFFEAAPAYRDWYFAQRQTALREGRIQTVFGRVRRWPLITRENKQSILNQAVNFPVQSVSSDLVLTMLMELARRLREERLGYVLFSVHDSVEAEIREGKEREAVALVREVMTRWPWPSPAALAVEVKLGRSWGDLTEWEET